jgi:adenylosuccinate lyase
MRVWNGEGQFLDFLKNDPEVIQAIPESELEALFDLAYHFKNVDLIFSRVFGTS